jgi:isopentenyl-diphosphate delta-isomerase
MNDINKIVSFKDELLILVDENDIEIGHVTKEICHNDSGMLHRAFSIFIFNDKKELLLQRRSKDKRLWPMYWSNSCCSHPRKGESNEYATIRRLEEELGLKSDLIYLYKFQYQAKFDDAGSENELCSVYIGKSSDIPVVNETEIAEWKYISMDAVDAQLKKNPQEFTPWFKMEWQQIRNKYVDQILAL